MCLYMTTVLGSIIDILGEGDLYDNLMSTINVDVILNKIFI